MFLKKTSIFFLLKTGLKCDMSIGTSIFLSMVVAARDFFYFLPLSQTQTRTFFHSQFIVRKWITFSFIWTDMVWLLPNKRIRLLFFVLVLLAATADYLFYELKILQQRYSHKRLSLVRHYLIILKLKRLTY